MNGQQNARYNEPKILKEFKLDVGGKKILLVDDVCRSGKTISKAFELLKENDVKSFLINGDGDFSLFNEQECLKMPWK